MPRRDEPARISDQAEELAESGRGSFQTLLYDAILQGMSEALGSAGAQAASFHLGIQPTSDAEEVHDGLVRVFGAGAASLELSIVRELYQVLGLAFEPGESKTFVECISYAREIHAERNEV